METGEDERGAKHRNDVDGHIGFPFPYSPADIQTSSR